ncbi:MAG: AAA family ATPase [Clostridiales bacterium]|nr:AAA family ATPase [Clostridiales bacterium]
MKRTAIDNLITWNQASDVRPVLLTGAKGVGKTYLAYDFAKAFFKCILYLNFEHDPKAAALFQDKDPFKVSNLLLEHFNLDAVHNESKSKAMNNIELKAIDIDEEAIEDKILILDEISDCPEALEMITALQFTGEFPKIIAISSRPLIKDELELYYHIPIYPLQFDEFLVAIGKDWYIEAIITHFDNNKEIPYIVHKELLALHNLYIQIGGMPGIVNEYLNFNNLSNIAEQHSLLMGTYQHYQGLINSDDGQALKMNQVLNCLPIQLTKNNKKFQYKLIRKGTTHAMYKDAIQLLSDQNHVIPAYKIVSEELSTINKAIEEDRLNVTDMTSFKLYLSDVGMLYSRLYSSQTTPFDKEAKKALLENYIAQAFQSKGYPVVFWESDSMAKIEFLLIKDKDLIPVEIFCDKNTRSKSVSVLKQKIDFPYSIKISSKNFEFSNNVKYVPYYAVFCL